MTEMSITKTWSVDVHLSGVAASIAKQLTSLSYDLRATGCLIEERLSLNAQKKADGQIEQYLDGIAELSRRADTAAEQSVKLAAHVKELREMARRSVEKASKDAYGE